MCADSWCAFRRSQFDPARPGEKGHTYTDSDSNCYAETIRDTDSRAHCDTDSRAHRDTDSRAHRGTDSDTDSRRHSDSRAYCDSNCYAETNCDSDSCANINASPDLDPGTHTHPGADLNSSAYRDANSRAVGDECLLPSPFGLWSKVIEHKLT